MAEAPRIAILGAGIFVKTQYIPRLAEISDLVNVKAIWSRSEESATVATEVARKFFPDVECKWGDKGLDEIIHDTSIIGVAVVLAGQSQIEISLKMLKAGKHVLQEKPAASSVIEAVSALSSYNSICGSGTGKPIWAVAENYRFEGALVESKKLINEIGDMMNVQLIVEGLVNSSDPLFSSSWRRNILGGFILDIGVHFIAGLRMLVGCEIDWVSALTSHVDSTMPPPDNISSLFQLENGCPGIFVMLVSAKAPKKIIWRIVGLEGTIQIERGSRDSQHGYWVSLFVSNGENKSLFFPFSGVTEELKAFLSDISQANLKKGASYEADHRSSYIEGARDVAVLEAMLESGNRQGERVQVKRF